MLKICGCTRGLQTLTNERAALYLQKPKAEEAELHAHLWSVFGFHPTFSTTTTWQFSKYKCYYISNRCQIYLCQSWNILYAVFDHSNACRVETANRAFTPKGQYCSEHGVPMFAIKRALYCTAAGSALILLQKSRIWRCTICMSKFLAMQFYLHQVKYLNTNPHIEKVLEDYYCTFCVLSSRVTLYSALGVT